VFSAGVFRDFALWCCNGFLPVNERSDTTQGSVVSWVRGPLARVRRRMAGAYQLVHLHPIPPTWGARASGHNGP